jgi:hypothetical protein
VQRLQTERGRVSRTAGLASLTRVWPSRIEGRLPLGGPLPVDCMISELSHSDVDEKGTASLDMEAPLPRPRFVALPVRAQDQISQSLLAITSALLLCVGDRRRHELLTEKSMPDPWPWPARSARPCDGRSSMVGFESKARSARKGRVHHVSGRRGNPRA